MRLRWNFLGHMLFFFTFKGGLTFAVNKLMEKKEKKNFAWNDLRPFGRLDSKNWWVKGEKP